jgi:hypothetical protein
MGESKEVFPTEFRKNAQNIQKISLFTGKNGEFSILGGAHSSTFSASAVPG